MALGAEKLEKKGRVLCMCILCTPEMLWPTRNVFVVVLLQLIKMNYRRIQVGFSGPTGGW